MVWWQVLELADQAGGSAIPQLLVKSVSNTDSYVVHLTDLSNIWSERLDLNGIVERASQVESPIEISKQDTSQLGILLDNVMRSLSNSGETSCRITSNDPDGITLNTTIKLPGPLDSLPWKFCLEKATAIELKNEFILPLLVSSHIQHQRITGLVSMITDKDKAITRLADQFESNNLDLAAAFPVLGGLKSTRKAIKREQAAKHITALQPFQENSWRKDTRDVEDSHLTTLGLFQEALAQSDAKVPLAWQSKKDSIEWWTALPDRLSPTRVATKRKAKEPSVTKAEEKSAELSEDETEDEFETYENFKTRAISKNATKAASPVPLQGSNEEDNTEEEAGEDSEDLDLPPKSSSFSQTRMPAKEGVELDSFHSASPHTSANTKPPSKAKGVGFRIGGKAKKASPQPSPPLQDDGSAIANTTSPTDVRPQSPPAEGDASMKTETKGNAQTARRPFRIGGKNKSTQNANEQELGPAATQRRGDDKGLQSPKRDTSTASRKIIKEETPPVEVKEETAEEKAERKRAELKRKNDEAARKQAQQKKKKRF